MKGNEILSIILFFIVIAVVLSIGADVLSTVQGTQTENTTEYNATNYGLQSFEKIGNFLPTISFLIVLIVVLGIVGFLIHAGSKGGV